jgi:hypothetical protein
MKMKKIETKITFDRSLQDVSCDDELINFKPDIKTNLTKNHINTKEISLKKKHTNKDVSTRLF